MAVSLVVILDQEQGAAEEALIEWYSFADEFTQKSNDSDRSGGIWVRVRDALFIRQQYVSSLHFYYILVTSFSPYLSSAPFFRFTFPSWSFN